MPRKRYAIVGDILTLLDEKMYLETRVDYLEAENSEYADKIRKLYKVINGEDRLEADDIHLNRVRHEIYENGRERIYKDASWYHGTIVFDEDEDTGELIPTPFDEWIDSKLINASLPAYMSMQDFSKLFEDKLRDDYDKDVHRAMEERLSEDES